MTNQSDDTESDDQDVQGQQGAALDQQEDQSYEHDQDSEPTMSAPEEGRPDGLDALKDSSPTTEEAPSE